MAGMRITPTGPMSTYIPAPVTGVSKSGPVDSRIGDSREKDKVKREKPEELSNVVSVSKDGDTVQVEKESAARLEEDAFGRMSIIGKDQDEEEKEENLVKVVSESSAPDEKQAVRKPEEDSEDEEEPKEEVKAVSSEGGSDQITSFSGYTDTQLEQMYVKGEISKYQLDRELESREEKKESMKAEDEAISELAGDIAGIENEEKKDAIELKSAFSPDSSDKTDPMMRLDMINSVENNILT